MENDINKKDINKLDNVLEKEEQIVSSYVSGKLKLSELEKKTLNPDNVLRLEESLILKFFEKGLPKNLKYSEDTLLYAYGRTLSAKAILKLTSLGYISQNKAILISNKHSLPITAPDLAVKPAEILQFYSAEVLDSMLNKKQIDNEFVRNFNSNIASVSEEERGRYFSSLVSDTKSLADTKKLTFSLEDDDLASSSNFPEEATKPEPTSTNKGTTTPKDNFSKLIFYYYELGILPANYTGGIVDFEYIQKRYETHKISYKNIVDLYINNVITSKQFLKILESSEVSLEEFYSGNIVSNELLKNITGDKKVETFVEALKSENLSTETLLDLYLYERVLTVEDLQQILLESKTQENLGAYIGKNADKKKVEELYTHFLIDYNCLVNFRREHFLTEAEFDEMKDKINSEIFYKDLSKITDLYIHTTPDNISASIHHSISSNRATQTDFKTEQEALHNLFDSPTEREKLPLIHATDLNGNKTSLDGYTCVPMPKFNVVTLKKFESDADTYVMPYQQAAFFLYNSYKPAEFTSGGGFEAEIPLPLEDYNDPMAISVVGYSLDYKRDLLESILELSNNERAKSELFFNGKPSPETEKFLNIDRDISKDIDKNLEREF